MKAVRVGYSKIFNASGCSLLGRDEILLRFNFSAINVEVYVGPNPRHMIASFTIGQEEPKDAKSIDHVSREQEYTTLSPENYPANLYTELVATQFIEVDDALASAFHSRNEVARDKILPKAEEGESSLITALDFVAGVLGLRLHKFLVSTPITEQRYAYRDNGTSYAISASLAFNCIATHDWDVSEGFRMPITKLQKQWTSEKAAEVLAWLLRAWAAKDPVLEFVSLFIPLECVIPRLAIAEKDTWNQKRSALLAIIENVEASQDSKELSKFLKELHPPQPSLASRFEKWATDVALPGWEQDVMAFKHFQKMRNSLVHAGNKHVKSLITVVADDVRTLENIAARYVSLALFGDANVYQIPRHTDRP
ncbi:hypothetical protein [Methyloglobulus sp.]|uniref:hypothetical protein n=1 Tax=Methyloglobulus sp. TaxID=2518622 RepID=UPI00398A24AF